MAKLRIKYFGPITEGFDSEDGFIDFSKLTLFIGGQGTGKTTVAKNVLSVVKNIEELDNLPTMLRLLRRRYLQGSENLKGDGSFNLPLSGYKALVNKSSGETFILEEKSGRAVLLVCASSGL